MRLQNQKKTQISKDEYICRALGIYSDKNKSVNPNQKRMRDRVRASFDSLYGDEEYFMNAKGDGKKKIGKWFDKSKQTIKKLADKVGDAAKVVGKTAAKATLFPIRQAARGVIQINFRGLASRMNNLNLEASTKLKDRWEQVGGERGQLEKSIETGSKRKMLACGKKCKAKSGYKGFDGDIFYSFTPEIDAMIASGIGLIGTLTAGLMSNKFAKNKAEYDKVSLDLQKEENKDDKTPPTAEDKAQADKDKKLALEQDPRTQIQNNPNLTEEEKIVAINELNKVLGDPPSGVSKNTKMILIVAGIAALALGIYAFTKRERS